MTAALRMRTWLRNLSLARKINCGHHGGEQRRAVAGVRRVARLRQLGGPRRPDPRHRMLADVVGATSTAAVSFGDAKAAAETLSAVAVNTNVRSAAILRDGGVFARLRPLSRHRGTSLLSGLDPGLVPHTAAGVHLRGASPLRVVRPIRLDGELIAGVYGRVRPRRAQRTVATAGHHHRRDHGRHAAARLRAVVAAATVDFGADPAAHRRHDRGFPRPQLRHPRGKERSGRSGRADRRLQRHAVGDSAARISGCSISRKRSSTKWRSAPRICSRRTPSCSGRATRRWPAGRAKSPVPGQYEP